MLALFVGLTLLGHQSDALPVVGPTPTTLSVAVVFLQCM